MKIGDLDWQPTLNTKLILCPLMAAMTYIEKKQDFRRKLPSLLEEHGCSKELARPLTVPASVVDELLSSSRPRLSFSSYKMRNQHLIYRRYWEDLVRDRLITAH